MPPANVAFDTNLLIQAQAAMDTAHSECTQLKLSMDQFHADLQSNWLGTASGAFTTAYSDFAAGYLKVTQGLASLQENLNLATQKLGINEQDVQQKGQALSSVINSAIGVS